MFHPKKTLQILIQPFKYKFFITDRRGLKSDFIICFLLVFLMFGLPSIHAQPHPDMDGFQLPPQARGDLYLSQGKFRKSLEIYKSILKDGAHSGPIFRNMVKAWNAIGALDEAKKYLSEYRQSHENSSTVWYALGYLHYLKDEDLVAEELFKRATELDSNNGLAWNNWAASLAKGKHFQEAVKKVRTAMLTNPKELMFFFNLKKIYEAMGEGQRFEAEYNDSVKEGTKPLAWGYGKTLARSLRQKSFREYAKGNKMGAIAGFENILNIYRQINDVKGQVPVLFSLGLLHEESGNVQKGQEFFRQVLSINPDHIQAQEKVQPIN